MRRLLNATAKRRAGSVALELLVLVIGVYLGLQAQDWQEHAADRERERDYLRRLAADFGALHQHLHRCITVYGNSVGAIGEVRAMLAMDSEQVDLTALGDALIRVTAGDVPASRSTTFIEMQASGSLGLLRDAALRDALIDYDQRAQSNRDIWRLVSTVSSEQVQTLYRHVSLEVDLADAGKTVIREIDFEAMAADAGISAMLNALIGSKANIYEICRYQSKKNEQVAQLLAQSTASAP